MESEKLKWDIRNEGRAWSGEEAFARYMLRPHKIEAGHGRPRVRTRSRPMLPQRHRRALVRGCSGRARMRAQRIGEGRSEPVAAIDMGFVLAVVAFGWGLSLATYRVVARHCGWPMGAWQKYRPGLPIGLGALAVLLAVLFALARAYGGYWLSAAVIPVFGLAWAIFWAGFLRVGAQSALLLAPIAALLLLLRWLSRVAEAW